MSDTATQPPSFRDALRFWLRLGFISFGGPAGQIAILHREVVEKRAWMEEKRFMAGLSLCTFLPGPEAQQLATYIGWSLHGIRGGLSAGILFFLPATGILLLLSFVRAEHGTVPLVAGILYGLRPVVVAIIADAGIRMLKKRAASWEAGLLALTAFTAAFLLRAPFPWIVLAAGLLGLLAPAFRRDPTPSLPESTPFSLKKEAGRLGKVLGVGLSLWAVPWVILLSMGDAARVFRKIYLFFTEAALVTFGGAYAVLSYVSNVAVDQFSWLSRAEAIDGLALAETTPGPLIMVLQYVGFFAAWNDPRGRSRVLSGAIGGLLTTYATFLPSLVLIFLAAPYVNRIGSVPRLAAGLLAIGAAVSGVVLSLSVDYGVAVVFPGEWTRPDIFAVFVLVGALTALIRGQGLGRILAVGASAGCLYRVVFQ